MNKHAIPKRLLPGLLIIAMQITCFAQPGLIQPDKLIQESFKDYQLIDTSYRFKLNPGTEQWELYSRTLTYLGTEDNPLLEINQLYDAGNTAWQNNERTIKAYGEKGEELQTLKQEWNNNFKDWIHVMLKTTTYEGRKKSEILYQEWMKPAGEWVNTTLYLIDYNDADYEESVVIKTYSVSSDSWNASTRYTFDYPHGMGKPNVVFVEKWIPDEKAWAKSGRYLLRHDARGNKVLESRSTWNDIQNDWIHGIKTMMEYDKKRIKNEVQQHWNFKKGKWENARRYLYNYNKEGELSTETRQKWNEAGNNWETTEKFMYTDVLNPEEMAG